MSDWQAIAILVPGRNDNQCHYKWSSEFKQSPQKAPWTLDEDSLLRQLIVQNGMRHWQEIAKCINSSLPFSKRQGKQCRERWINFLDPSINKNPWTEDEDLVLLMKQQKKGKKWAEIAKEMEGRTENQVKNRFNALIKKIREEKTYDLQKRADI